MVLDYYLHISKYMLQQIFSNGNFVNSTILKLEKKTNSFRNIVYIE